MFTFEVYGTFQFFEEISVFGFTVETIKIGCLLNVILGKKKRTRLV
jgi:hypothetical protein